ncbi:aldolase/citrate lyase family protein, partial [Streptomyces sp. NPDC059627]
MLDSPIAAERLARLGYDYLAFDAQHGLFGYQGLLNNLLATDTKGSTAVGMVRVEANDLTYIGKALDAGATAVIVPLVDSARDAADAVAAVRYPPLGRRSYGPIRAPPRFGPNPAAPP